MVNWQTGKITYKELNMDLLTGITQIAAGAVTLIGVGATAGDMRDLILRRDAQERRDAAERAARAKTQWVNNGDI